MGPWGAGAVIALGLGLAAGDMAPRTTLEERVVGGRYAVEARFLVAAPPAIVWRVLTDYAHLPRFVRSVKRSAIERRPEPGRGIVLVQELRTEVLGLRRTVRVRLFIRESPPARIEFRDLAGVDFDEYVGSWIIAPAPDGSAVTYRIEMRPRHAPPAFLVAPALKKSASLLIADMRAEIARRAESGKRGIR